MKLNFRVFAVFSIKNIQNDAEQNQTQVDLHVVS